jgi:UTP-glucose-1-phosphate uridylyltransferase
MAGAMSLETGRMAVTSIVEKPSATTAKARRTNSCLPCDRVVELVVRASLSQADYGVAGLPAGQYATTLGLYVVEGRVFRHLQDMDSGNTRRLTGDFQFTPALEQVLHAAHRSHRT